MRVVPACTKPHPARGGASGALGGGMGVEPIVRDIDPRSDGESLIGFRGFGGREGSRNPPAARWSTYEMRGCAGGCVAGCDETQASSRTDMSAPMERLLTLRRIPRMDGASYAQLIVVVKRQMSVRASAHAA